MKQAQKSVIIVGSGISGLYAAIKISQNCNLSENLMLVTKSVLKESNSRYAQGGIVGVLPDNKDDSVQLHVKDTLIAGAGLSDSDIATDISINSAQIIKDLISLGVEFDKDENNNFSLTTEGAHSTNRILHAGGDATGKNIELVLCDRVKEIPNIEIREKTQVVELLVDSDKICRGVILFNENTGEYEKVFASAVIIATGGVGQVYSNTTNPKIATGDGIALAFRADAQIQNMEFIQFHPTALTIQDNDTRFLISESVRGEGAKLKNLKGEYFAQKYHELGDLAPRDIVTRSIFFEMSKDDLDNVLLDTSFIDENTLRRRFPTIYAKCLEKGIDIFKEPIPVSPAAHYCMGGIKVTLDGKTNISGLYAIGEASCNALHGANRLASNSLLECVVSSQKLSETLAKIDLKPFIKEDIIVNNTVQEYDKTIPELTEDIEGLISELKDVMWNKAGIIRTEKGLSEALKIIYSLEVRFSRNFKCATLREYEFRSLLATARLVVIAALARKESRGAHYRQDYPTPSQTAYHSVLRKGEFLTNELHVTRLHH